MAREHGAWSLDRNTAVIIRNNPQPETKSGQLPTVIKQARETES
jgi:hypothetical protein